MLTVIERIAPLLTLANAKAWQAEIENNAATGFVERLLDDIYVRPTVARVGYVEAGFEQLIYAAPIAAN
jgi:hypothetical protein